MAKAPCPSAILDNFQSDESLAEFEHIETVQLTPHLVLATSLLYMMTSDGQVEEEESSQLQAAIGGHEALLRFALRYVQQVPVEEFLAQAPEVLSAKDKICILANVCDSMMSDGRSEPDELEMFSKFLEAFGLSQSVFGAYFKTITLKNDKSVLGHFEGVSPDSTKITPHLALAASLLYMMSADGSIGAEEIGQLEAVIGEFDGLQQVALTYVRKVKRGEFLRTAASMLTDTQKLCILTNVCDSMLSDGTVAMLEDKLFVSMLDAFGYSENAFQIYYLAIETKNIKPFDTSHFRPHTKHSRARTSSKEEGELFDKKFSWNEQKNKAQVSTDGLANNGDGVPSSGDDEMGAMIHRTMQDNINSVNQDFGSQDNVIKVGANATHQLNVKKVSGDGEQGTNRQTVETGATKTNVQKLQSAQDVANRQVLSTEVAARPNLQTIPSGAYSQNRQILNAAISTPNQQNIDADLYAAYGAPVGLDKQTGNVQEISVDSASTNVQLIAEATVFDDHIENVPTEHMVDHLEDVSVQARLDNLFEDIDTLNRKLDDFEQKNKWLLEIARQAKLEARRKEEEALLAQGSNRQTVEIPVQTANMQVLKSESLRDNLQEVPIETFAVNRQKIPPVFQSAQIVLNGATDATTAPQAIIDLPTSPNALGQMQTAEFSQDNSQPWAEMVDPLLPHSLKQRTRHNKNHYPAQVVATLAISYRAYVRATVTFVVLSCWASSIAAIDAVRTQLFVGVLERSVQVQATEEAGRQTID